MKSHFEILEQSDVRFGYRISVLANWYRGPGYKAIERDYNLTEPEISALFCIGHSDYISATDVCAITGRPKNSMSRAIALLMEKGMLEREADGKDGRKKLLKLTAPGRATYAKIVPIFLQGEADILTPLTPSELSDLDKLLTKMTRHVTRKLKTY